MPYEADDQRLVDEAIADAQGSTKLLIRDPDESQKLGWFSVMCTIWNRGIETGQEAHGGALEGETVLECVPRNGGEKNYLEYIYKAPKLRTISMYGIVYIILGNLSGNAIAFGIYVLEAAGITGHDAAIRGLAVAASTVACLLHGLWRQGGIVVNNIFASLKILILIAVIIIGFAASAGAKFGHGPVHGKNVDPLTGKVTPNFDTHSSFAHAPDDVASYAQSLLFIIYTYSGFEQPFYVLSEVKEPKRVFAKTTIAAMGVLSIIFVLANIAYLCAVSFDQRLDRQLDMATLFFTEIFGTNAAPRVMSGIIALSILGNIVVMTFTASRVKQEIAKEGILGKHLSLFFASSFDTPYARLQAQLFPSQLPKSRRPPPEQSPLPALFLHWMFSMVMIGASSSTTSDVSYTILVSLYSYAIVILVGFFVAGGLLYLRFASDERRTWVPNAGFKPWGGPTAAIIYTLVCAFMIVTAFLPPSVGSVFHKSKTQPEWWIVPTVGLAILALGYFYYLLFAYAVPRIKKQRLFVERKATIVRDHGEWVQAVERVEAVWVAREGPMDNSANVGGNYVETVTVEANKAPV
ncbi:MAG: hypothetical protein M1836_003338 [Candelina mexicana]|nr:MAG: hypothetical protein M1836_003338 [Candelina mexicana]